MSAPITIRLSLPPPQEPPDDFNDCTKSVCFHSECLVSDISTIPIVSHNDHRGVPMRLRSQCGRDFFPFNSDYATPLVFQYDQYSLCHVFVVSTHNTLPHEHHHSLMWERLLHTNISPVPYKCPPLSQHGLLHMPRNVFLRCLTYTLPPLSNIRCLCGKVLRHSLPC